VVIASLLDTLQSCLRSPSRGPSQALRLGFTLLVVCGLCTCSGDAHEYELVSERSLRVVLPERRAIEPLWIGTAGDGNVVVAGQVANLKLAWAAKIDAHTGRAIWTFELGRDGITATPAMVATGASPNIMSVVPLPDEGAYLCGNIPPPTLQDRARMFLVRLDSEGRPKTREFINPAENVPSVGYAAVRACLPWGSRIAVIGTYMTTEKVAGAQLPRVSNYYWIRSLDQSGNTVFDKSYEALNPAFIPDPAGLVAVPWQSGVLVSATDNVDTELMYVSDQGELRASTRFAGQQLYLVRHSVGLGNDNIQAFGRDGTTPYAPKTLLTLDEHLRVIARRGATTEWTFAGPFIFGMPDQALVGFGCRVQHGLSLQRSAAMLLDGDLKARKSLFFEDADVFDSGTVTAAGSLSAQGEYVVGRMAGSAPNPNANPSVLPVGLIVNFVHARQLPHE
jgi:hypothetical protein